MLLTDHILSLPLTQPVAIFLLVLVIILIAPLLFGRLKVPNIVVLILAGVAVGPHGFNILARDASFEIFGQVGILYLMFLAAAEIDMYHLRQNYRPGILFGLLTFIIPMAIGIPLTRWMLHTDWQTAVLISTMYASHTLVSYPIVSRFGLANNRAAVVAVCGTIGTVLLALITLAEVVDIHKGIPFGIGPILRLLTLTALYTAVVALAFPWATRLFFKKFSDGVAQFIFILALVFIAALAAQLIGLEAILGAFLAGLVLNRFIPARSQLMRHITFVGNAIFIPYFMIGVGMLIDVRAIFHGWGVMEVVAVMTCTAVGSKLLAVAATHRLFHLTRPESLLMFGLTSGKAAATIAATMIGYQYGLLTEDMMNGAVVMILVCCIIASVTTERAAIMIRMDLTARELRDEAPQRAGFARQLVAVSNPMTAESIMRLAAYMRSPMNEEPLTALFVRSGDDRRAAAEGREALSEAEIAANEMDIPFRHVERYDLNIVAGLTNVMAEWKSTEVIIGMHRRASIVDSFFGHMIDQLLASTDRMVVMSRCFIPVPTIRRIIVAAPKNAEYETGFAQWVTRIGNLASALACKTLFLSYPDTSRYIEANIREAGCEFSHEYCTMESWDDFIILSSQVGEDDLMIVVTARKGSISCTSDLDNLPTFLSRHFRRHNLMMIVPAQFGIR